MFLCIARALRYATRIRFGIMKRFYSVSVGLWVPQSKNPYRRFFGLGCDSIFIFFARSLLFALNNQQLDKHIYIYICMNCIRQPLHPCVYYLYKDCCEELFTQHTEAHRSDFVRMTYISSIAISERMCAVVWV